MTEREPTITVLAGINGAGKSSIIGAWIRAQGCYYNPDELVLARLVPKKSSK